MDINLLLEPRGSEPPAGNRSTTSVASSLTGKAWTNTSALPTHTKLLINATTPNASPAYLASAPIPASSPAGLPVQDGPSATLELHQQQVQPDPPQHPQTIRLHAGALSSAPPPLLIGSNIIDSPPLQTAKRAASPTPLSKESPAKKQSKWTQEEDNLTIELRGTGMKWDDIAKRIPGRSSISCRLRYQNYLEKRAVWDEEKKNKLARLYARFKDQMWQKVASEMQIPWRSAESMHWQLGEQEMSLRANAPVFQASNYTHLPQVRSRRQKEEEEGLDAECYPKKKRRIEIGSEGSRSPESVYQRSGTGNMQEGEEEGSSEL